ncbi:MAG TPA: thioredoxin domain-containing protein, partial [Phycisphaerae bacterium]
AARIAKYPGGFDRLLAAADMRLSRSKEIALIGEPNATEMRAMLRTVFERYLPNKVVMGAPSGVADWPLLAAKQAIDGRPTAYVCENYACQKPVTSASELATLLER